ncbi:MAG: hypothetical protein ABIC57_03550, partial [bacterium]
IVDTIRNTLKRLEELAPPKLKDAIRQRFVDWMAQYRKEHVFVPHMGGATSVNVHSRTTKLDRWERQLNKDFAENRLEFVTQLLKDYPNLIRKVK